MADLGYSFYCSRCKFDHPGECKVEKNPCIEEFTKVSAPVIVAGVQVLHPDCSNAPSPSGKPWARFIPSNPIAQQRAPFKPWMRGQFVAVHLPSSQGTTKIVFEVMEDSDYPKVRLLAANGSYAKIVGQEVHIARDSRYGEHSLVI